MCISNIYKKKVLPDNVFEQVNVLCCITITVTLDITLIYFTSLFMLKVVGSITTERGFNLGDSPSRTENTILQM